MQLKSNNLYILFIVFFTISIVGCKKNIENNEITNICIEAGVENDSNIYLSTISKEISYIPLETAENNLIGDINFIRFYDDFLIVVDDLPQILLFNKNGKFIKKIGNIGKGPNEFVNVTQIEFSPKSNDLYIYDGSMSKLMAFDINTGLCTREKLISFYPSTLSLLNDSILGCYCSAATFPFSTMNFHLILLDKNFNVKETFWQEINKTENNLKNIDRGFIETYLVNNKLVCWDSNVDTIFSFDLNSKTITPEFKFDAKKYNIPDKYKYSKKLYENNRGYFTIDKFIETNNFFFIEGVYDNKFMKNILYDKNTGNSKNVVFNYAFHDIGFHNDLDGGIPFWPKGVASKNSLYDFISPFELKKLMENKYYNTIKIKDIQKNQELYKYIANSEITDNPMIFILTLK